MSTSIPTRLRAIRQFLEGEILPGVASDLRGEMRAALKILEKMEREVDELPALLESENQQMLRICEKAIASVGHLNVDENDLDNFKSLLRQVNNATKTVSDLLEQQAKLSVLLGKLTVLLSARIEAEPQSQAIPSAPRTVFTQCCVFLQRQAQARSRWQGVFPRSRLYQEEQSELGNQGDGA